MTTRVPGARTAGTVRPRVPRAPAPTEADRAARRAHIARLVGVVGMLVATVALWWLLGDDAFRVRAEDVTIEGNAIAAREAILARLEPIDRAANVLRLRLDDLLDDLRAMPEVRDASVSVSLPAAVSIHVEERVPLFVWTDERASWLVDGEGVLFAAPDAAGIAVSPATGRRDGVLPIVTDVRLREEPVTVGSRLDPIDLAAMTHLLALDPERIGSDTGELQLRVDESFGYVLRSPERAWRARFGHYTPTLYRPDRIPLQVQCLAALLAAEEERLDVVWLVPSEHACGTFVRSGTTG